MSNLIQLFDKTDKHIDVHNVVHYLLRFIEDNPDIEKLFNEWFETNKEI